MFSEKLGKPSRAKPSPAELSLKKSTSCLDSFLRYGYCGIPNMNKMNLFAKTRLKN